MIVETAFHSISGGGLLCKHPQDFDKRSSPKLCAWEATRLYDRCKNVRDLSDYMETNLNKENKLSKAVFTLSADY